MAREYSAQGRTSLVRRLQYELGSLHSPGSAQDAGDDAPARLPVRALVHVASSVTDVDFEIEERDCLHPAGEPTSHSLPGGTVLAVPFEVLPPQQRKADQNELPLAHARFFLGAGADVCPVPIEAAPDTSVTVSFETRRGGPTESWQVSALSRDGWTRSRSLGDLAVLPLRVSELERSLLFVGPVVELDDDAARSGLGAPPETTLLSLAPEDRDLLEPLRVCVERLDDVCPRAPQRSGGTLVVSQTSETFHVPAWTLGASTLSPISIDDPISIEDTVTRLAYVHLVRRFELLPEQTFWLHGIARRLAVEIVSEVFGHDPERAWRDRLAAYVFYSATQDGDLALREPRGHQRHCLYDLKAPLFVRWLELGDGVDAQGDGASSWLRFLEQLSSGSSAEEALAASLGSAARGRFLDHERGDALRIAKIAADLSLQPHAPREGESSRPHAKLVLALTSNTENFLETCGCKLRQQGGIARRSTALERVAQGHPLLALDLGNLAPRKLEPFQVDDLVRAEAALHMSVAADMGYAGFALGPNELLLGPSWIRSVQEDGNVGFQSCNVRLRPETAGRTSPPWETRSQTVDIDGRRVRLIAVTATVPYWVAPEELGRHAGAIEIEEPIVAIERELEGADPEELIDELIVVYGQIPPWKIAEIVAAHPELDVVASCDRWVLPGTSQRTTGPGDFFLESGFLGQTFVALANEESHGLALFELALDERGRVAGYEERLQVLDEDLPDDAAVRARMSELYATISIDGFHPQAKKLFLGYPGERQLLLEGPGGGRRGYVGAETCRSCHADAYAAWSATPHATAFATLEERLRDRAPACVGCHVVGYGLPTGYEIDRDERAHLRGVQCESCHGPGAEHVRQPSVTTIRPTIPAEACGQCHDAEHSEPLGPRWEEAFAIGAHRVAPASRSGAGLYDEAPALPARHATTQGGSR